MLKPSNNLNPSNNSKFSNSSNPSNNPKFFANSDSSAIRNHLTRIDQIANIATNISDNVDHLINLISSNENKIKTIINDQISQHIPKGITNAKYFANLKIEVANLKQFIETIKEDIRLSYLKISTMGIITLKDIELLDIFTQTLDFVIRDYYEFLKQYRKFESLLIS